MSYVKIYFGRYGPGSGEYYHGVIAAVPLKYKSAEPSKHDVGFVSNLLFRLGIVILTYRSKVRLNEAIQHIKPIPYTSTPAHPSATEFLGLVGFPGDLGGGHYMYEHWKKIKVKSVGNGGLISYKCDTSDGRLTRGSFNYSKLNRIRSIRVSSPS